MKKWSILLLVVILMLSSCAAPVSDPQGVPSYEDFVFPTIPGTVDRNAYKQLAPDMAGEAKSIVIESYEEYEDFLASHRLPDDFITYEQLSSFGRFGDFIFYPLGAEYHYYVIDEAGVELAIHTYPIKEQEETVAVEEPSADLRTSSEGISRKIAYRGMIFSYLPQGLHYVAFEAYGRSIHLNQTEPPFLSCYPDVAEPTLVSRLLTKDTAPAAMAQIAEQLRK